ncbi:PPOX class F420-dependent oxidoreductase [Microbispora cellulosiformans]|uniref:PPOX class F420-dependent oxidoreductase n=1 Tax=Microbispora cellulosiformans TaxID=2614688 RepID=A0A5J5JUP6_9ACTN|nr:PPOX class F420-dependent oxidoreductase [Microbispora cellulosiformans]KAA9373683.1 PPOX class F420-dependent oxidoreductase [Microbispora cellulosiformans]
MIFTEREIEYLRGQRIGRLATLQPNGTLQVSPVGFRYNPGLQAIDIAGRAMAASRKFRNVLANGRVAFVVDDVPSVDPWLVRCLEIRGYGEALAEPADSAAPLPGPIIRLHPRRVISFGVDPGNPASGARDVPSH